VSHPRDTSARGRRSPGAGTATTGSEARAYQKRGAAEVHSPAPLRIPIWLDEHEWDERVRVRSLRGRLRLKSIPGRYQFRVFCHLCCRAHKPERPRSIESIAGPCCMDLRTVRLALLALEAAGLCWRDRRPGLRGRRGVPGGDVYGVMRQDGDGEHGDADEIPFKRRPLIPDWLDTARLDASAFRLAAHIARRQEGSGQFFQRVRVTAVATGLSLGSVHRATERLIEARLLRPTTDERAWRLVKPDGSLATPDISGTRVPLA
jgi:hypothetical protein